MRPITTLCFAAFAVCQSAMACSWIPIPFCETSNMRPNDVVLSGRIMGVDADGIDVEVIDVLRGEEDRAVIRIWDGTDWDCNGPFSMAASDLGGVDDSIIVVLPLITEIENTWDVLGDYRRPDYFGHITELRITDGVVTGFITGHAMSPVDEMPYADVLALWDGGLGTCSELSVDDLGQARSFTAHLVHSVLNVTIRSDAGSMATIRIHASNGPEILAVNGVPGTMQIDLSGLAVGLYHIVLIQQDGSRSFARIMAPGA